MSSDGASVRKIRLGEAEIEFETGAIARQASSVLVRQDDTVILVTAVGAKEAKPGTDFFPLTVEYREKIAAGGRIPGSYQRRESRSTELEILSCRLVDRSVRPLFPDGFHCEVQVLATVLSADPGTDLPVLSILGACAALELSDLPFEGPAGGIRIAKIGGRFVAMPNPVERREAELDLVVSASAQGLVMVEGGAKESSEDEVVEALLFAQKVLEPFQRLCAEWRAERGAPKRALAPAPRLDAAKTAEIASRLEVPLREALAIAGKHERKGRVKALLEEVAAATTGLGEDEAPLLRSALEELHVREVRRRIVEDGVRLDGRDTTTVRPISSRAGWLPRAHGSSLFTRGETQAIVTCTLGSGDEVQKIETVFGTEERHFLLHYNFPPYSVGETRPLRGPGRREIGHGALARRALQAVLPSFEQFPYVLRIDSEISESNGSSSMATVCGGCLALMDCGVPLSAPVAGIAMGLVKEGDQLAVLSDILGDEDHLGDMDFKVCGTARGITALQMDNKLGALPREVLIAALAQARDGRAHILAEMAKTLAAPRPELPKQAPRVLSTRIRPERIGALIGPRGETIKEIQSSTGTKVSVDDTGLVCVYGTDGIAAKAALRKVREAAGDVEKGRVYAGTVTGVKDFGCFVRIYNGIEGLVHVSELAEGFIEHPSRVVQEGDEILVRVQGADERGKLALSRRAAAGTAPADVAN
ncbi:MAG: polyribonucleotide nucleotidyltransferase [Planctomycetes bacterium]|nr:polyribonucleotide nucleotidyltransferase [Planctomycetota bacterium]